MVASAVCGENGYQRGVDGRAGLGHGERLGPTSAGGPVVVGVTRVRCLQFVAAGADAGEGPVGHGAARHGGGHGVDRLGGHAGRGPAA